MAHAFAIENEHIRADMIEISEFPYLANKYQVQGVPKTLINEEIEVAGMVPEYRLIDEVLKGLEPKQWSH